MKTIGKYTLLSLILLLISSPVAFNQCNDWNDSIKKSDAEDAHSIYRQALKANDYEVAFENWQIAYDIAPAADGKRDYHFVDGAKLYGQMFKNASAEEKPALLDKVVELYEQAVSCYESGAIKPSNCEDGSCYPKRIGTVYSKMGFDMFYTLNVAYSKNLAAYDKALENAGNNLDYTIFDPILTMAVYQYEKELIDKEAVLNYYNQLEAIANYNIENDKQLGEYFDQAWRSAKAKLSPIEAEIFDCDYFKPSLENMYDEDPDNPETLRTVVALLKKRNCPATDSLLIELEAKWKVYAVQINAERQAEFEANNPSVMAKKLYDEGDFEGAINKYDEAISQETDDYKKAGYLFSKASILFRKQNKYGQARSTAREAANLRPDWGRPYSLIGDMYGKTARSCGDSWNQSLAIIAAIDKYSYAKSIDPEVADEVNRKIGIYRKSLPTKDEGFMRGVKAGESATVGCWIGESVRLRYR